jgi:hypothetical protein
MPVTSDVRKDETGPQKVEPFLYGKPAKRSFTTIVLAGAAALALVIGIVGGVASQAGHIRLARQDALSTHQQLTAVQARLGDSQVEVIQGQSELTQAQGELASQRTQLASCATAASIGVEMDGVLNDLVDNALFNGSLSEWDNLWDRYDGLGDQWAATADACDPSAGFTFG